MSPQTDRTPSGLARSLSAGFQPFRTGGFFFPAGAPLPAVFRSPAVGFSALVGLAWLALHLWSLEWFPFVHSDEAWLASLSRTIWLEKNPAATEEFFRLTPRTPHAIKTLYHLLQGPLVATWWTIGAARLPSLAGGVTAVALLGVILRRQGLPFPVAAAITLAFALDPLVFAASHLARQEALILAALAGGIAAGSAPAAGVILGLAVFVHPNSFIAASGVLPWVLYRSRPGRRFRDLAVYLGMLALAGAIALALSLRWDPAFFSNYLAFGRSVGVTAHPLVRFGEALNFIVKMSLGIAGTYYLPPALVQLVTLAVVTPLALALSCWPGVPETTRRLLGTCAWSSLCTAAALVMIGKYSPPSTVFLVPGLYCTLGALAQAMVRRWSRRRVTIVLTGIALAMAGITGTLLTGELLGMYPPRISPDPSPGTAPEASSEISPEASPGVSRGALPEERASYGRYLARITAAVPPGTPVLAPLNSAFAFEPGQLRVWRDLDLLPSGEASLERFLREEGVQWLVVPREELRLIYRERPLWNQVYGNPHRFYRELEDLLERRGRLRDSFLAPWYGARMIPLARRVEPLVEIYQLDFSPGGQERPGEVPVRSEPGPPEEPGSAAPDPGRGLRGGSPPGGS